MYANKYLSTLVFLLAILPAYASMSYGQGCFTNNEAKQVATELKNKWWSSAEQQKLDIEYVASYLIPKAGSADCLVLIKSNEKKYDCHSCPADLGIAVYSKSGNNWNLSFDQKKVASLGQWGKLPESTIVEIGENNFGIKFHNASMYQGNYSEGFTLIARVNGRYKEVITVSTHGDDSGASAGTGRNPTEWNADVQFIEAENKQFYDIRVVRKGTEGKYDYREGTSEIIPVNETTTYRFIGDKYEIVQ